MNNIWHYFGILYIAHCKSIADAKKIASWTDCELFSTYFSTDGSIGGDTIFPKKHLKRVCQLLGIETQLLELRKD